MDAYVAGRHVSRDMALKPDARTPAWVRKINKIYIAILYHYFIVIQLYTI